MNTKTALRRRKSGDVEPRVIAGIAFAVIALFGITLRGCGGGVDGGSIFTFLGGVFNIIFHNVGFWIMFVVAVVFGFVRKFTNPEQFMWRELPIQIGASILSLVILYCIFFSTATNLADKEIWNGYVTKAEYYEQWTEKVTSRDKKGRTTTSYRHHPPSWVINTTAGDFSTSSEVYNSYRHRFDNQTKKNLYHMNQSSFGDGDMFYVECDRNQASLMPAARPHLFVNYLRASDSIRKIRGNIEQHKANLKEYPVVYAGDYGDIEFDRVIEAGITLPPSWKVSLDEKLDRELRNLGAEKEVNVLVYITGSPDRSFAEALKEYWVQGKKNDVIVIVGAPTFPEIRWVEVIAWTKVEEFKIHLRDRITEMKTLPAAGAFATAITQEIAKPGSAGGFVRTPDADLEYLAADVSLPWWCQLIIILVGGSVSWFTSHFLINNDWRSGRSSFGYGRKFNFG